MFQRQWFVIVLALAYGLITRLLFTSDRFTPVSVGFLAGVPFAIGVITAYFALMDDQDKTPPFGRAVFASFVPSTIFLFGLGLLNVEIAICLVMAAPLFYTVAFLGGIVGYVWWRFFGDRRSMRSVLVVVAALPYLVTPLEVQLEPTTITRTVHSEIMIQTVPETVWQNIIRVPRITDGEQRFSLFHWIGIPRPLEAQLETEGVGSIRRGLFEDGLKFNERISVWKPNEAISFDIDVDHSDTGVAALYQIGGKYFDILNAAYRIEQVDDDTVILHLSGSYSLKTSFNAYAVIWTDYVMEDFQNYVLSVVKNRAESA